MNKEEILRQLNAYKHKFYISRLIKGLLICFSVCLAAFMLISVLEYYGNFGRGVRSALFFGFLVVFLVALFRWVTTPIVNLFGLKHPLSDEQAARQIGMFFPDIKDKLLNTLQLSMLSDQQNQLVTAAIAQKSQSFTHLKFTQAVEFKENKPYLRYIILVAIPAFLLAIIIPELYLESSRRIIGYNQVFVPQAPFQIQIINPNLEVFASEPYLLELQISGTALPEQVFFSVKGRKNMMQQASILPASQNGLKYSYALEGLQNDLSFEIEAAGYVFGPYTIKVIHRPFVENFKLSLIYPSYLNKAAETLENTGNLLVPAGTKARWVFESQHTDSLVFSWPGQANAQALKQGDSKFVFTKQLLQSCDYSIRLANEHGSNKEKIAYYAQVIPDRYPLISLRTLQDSVLFEYVLLAGDLSDDYGLSALKLFYRKTGKGSADNAKYSSINLSLQAGNNSQNYFYRFNTAAFAKLAPGERLEYYVSVWDNDGLSGPKESKTAIQYLNIPGAAQMQESISQSDKQISSKMEQSLKSAAKLKKDLEKIRQKLRSKPELDWQDTKDLKELLAQKQALEQQLEQTQKELELNQQKNQALSKPDPQTSQKLEQLQKLMQQLMDPETKKLYDKLQKLLEQQSSPEQISQALKELDKRENTLNKELDRALELFKQMQLEKQLEQTAEKLDELAKKQEELSQKTQNTKADDKKAQDKLKQEQNELKEMFEQIKQDIKALEEINKSLETPAPMEDTAPEQQNTDQQQENSEKELDNKQNKKASKSQKEAAKSMKEMAEKLKKSLDSMEGEQKEEDAQALRQILDNLITLSFEQEELLKEMKKTNFGDPKFVQLGQAQLALKDKAVIVEDSLNALAKRVIELEAFVTKELANMKDQMEQSLENFRQRRPDLASGRQQLAMTSMNNLALLLTDALDQMKENSKKSGKGSGKGKKKGKKKGEGSLGSLQKQLNDQIQQLMKSGKTGRGLSEELSKLAGQQEMIRRQLGQLQQMLDKQKGGAGKMGEQIEQLQKEMKKTEQDLVNKRLNSEMNKRQQEISTRLLEAENAAKEREQDEKRESKAAKDIIRTNPDLLEQYFKEKQKSSEIIKYIPPNTTYFYRQEINKYFNRLSPN